MTEQSAPYPSASPAPSTSPSQGGRVRTRHLQACKDEGRRFAMLTAYDHLTASLFEQSGVDVLLVGDSAANTVLGESTTLPMTVEDLLVFTRAVSRGARRALVVADLPFGSFENSPEQAFTTAARFLKEGGAHAVKIEGAAQTAPTVRHLSSHGIPVIAHIGFTPQSEHALGGYRVQGRADDEAARLLDAARALEDAGAFAVLMEMVPAAVAARVDEALRVPTIGIGAGAATTGQVLVWQDALGLTQGRTPRFVKQYARLADELRAGVEAYVDEVLTGAFPTEQHSF
ncbi:3-methyl-2-oxobutanoate hydroxymethyltransferase [Falsarthrobacter nasiphocae]|uniref:3-methyl-2-oxobutanoate hydroxymethyltransferase n=1 Tax=Falsarthrobacter nasiphocae TaxID=189863 RepID=A0AAE3YDB2_9MICC|nr:3-methyl-2-oxobutanoate hydroxymethyltransferase [Falsarthrobacter nasiphocae]MDR6891299.1 3-methyl-2-oxobutanoate hydroxymethyltransferase [Falsarthrobacter nasiphocae]